MAPRAAKTVAKIVGRKRHIAVDTDGRLLMVKPTTTDVSDGAGAQLILDGILRRWPWLNHLFADRVYNWTRLMESGEGPWPLRC